ncbi:unnamed protein product [Bathycoccus prasinos]|jgi:hypothetical protein
MGRRKNPHPKRAVNARTVLKVARDKEEEVEEEEEPLVLCLRIPEEEDDLEANHHQIQKEETTFNKKGTKRKRAQHECDVCEKRFATASGLKRHVRIHANEKPYECDVCEMKFRRSDTLKVHMRRWH